MEDMFKNCLKIANVTEDTLDQILEALVKDCDTFLKASSLSPKLMLTIINIKKSARAKSYSKLLTHVNNFIDRRHPFTTAVTNAFSTNDNNLIQTIKPLLEKRAK